MTDRPSPGAEWTRGPRAVRARVREARRSTLLRYGVALASIAAAVPFTASLRAGVLHDHSFFVAAVFVAAWVGGLGPGLLAAALGTVVANYFFTAPAGAFGSVTPEDLFRLAMLGAVAAGVGYLSGSQQRALARAKALADESEAAAEQLRGQTTTLEATIDALAATADAAQTAREEYQRLIETANEGVWKIDTEGRTTYVNARMAAMLGYTPEEMAGRPIYDFMDEEWRPEGAAALARRLAGESGERDVRYRRRDGTDLWTRAITNPIRDANGCVVGALGMFTDITERRRAERRLAFLADASATLAKSLDYELTLGAVAKLAVDELAETCAIDLVDQGSGAITRVAVRSTAPQREAQFTELVQHYPILPDEPYGPARAIRTGEAELAVAVEAGTVAAVARDAGHRAALQALDLHSVIVAPLTAAGRTIGAITLVRHGVGAGGGPRPFDEADLALAEELARRAAVAIDAARLLRAAEDAEGRAHFLAAASDALSTGLGQEERLTKLVDLVVPSLADYCMVDLVGADEQLRRLAVAHVDPVKEALLHETAGSDSPPPDSRSPVVVAARAGEPQLLARVTDELLDAGAASPRHLEIARTLRPYSAMVVPLVARGRVLGVLSFARSEAPERRFGAADLEFATELARRAALAVDNARLYEAEQAARHAAERASARAQFLSEASVLLSSELQEEVAVGAVARLAVPRIADWCAVDMLDDGAAIRRLAIVHSDPVLVAVARLLEHAGPAGPDAPYGPPRVIRSGKTAVLRDSTRADGGEEGGVDEGRLRFARALGIRSYICAPLVARGRTIGAVTLATAESGRVFDAEDLALAEDLARRTAVALDNARLYRAAQAANKAKSDFLATMSHELRTPLNAIGGYAQLMEMGLRGPVTAQQREDLARIQKSQHHLLSLINDVLSFAKIEAAHVRYDVRPHPVRALVSDVDVLVAPQLSAKQLMYTELPFDDSLAVLADRERAQQVLVNLLSNAIKFTAPGGRVTLSCEADGDRVLLRVRDTGVGIPAAQLDAIFEPFMQVHSGLTRPAGGTGLGLAISRELARAMGGELTVESEVGVGSTFTLTLPRAPAPAD